MTQLGEPLKIGMIADGDMECPFDHSEAKPVKLHNELVGTGTKLKNRMEAGQSTDLVAKPKLEARLSPRKIKDFPFYDGAESIVLRVVVRQSGKSDVKTHRYRLALAAHHCIPAQESLKRAEGLLAWMNSKTDGDDVKEGSDQTRNVKGLIRSSIGYDINGSENGVWLPGNYAVCGSRNGSLWQDDADVDIDDDDEEIVDPPGPAGGLSMDAQGQSRVELMPVDDGDGSNRLYGESFDVGAHNRKWHYVWQAMQQSKAQFHDRHESYSEFVLKILLKIASQYVQLAKQNYDGMKCSDCKKVKEKAQEDGYPPPYKLKKRLDGVASRLGAALTGPAWPPGIHTSKWVKRYTQHLQKLKLASAGSTSSS